MAKLTRIEQRMIDEFILRHKENAAKDRIDNSSLVAGSPMFYYCKGCRAFIASMPENHISAVPQYCEACKRLEAKELLAEAKRRAREQEDTASRS